MITKFSLIEALRAEQQESNNTDPSLRGLHRFIGTEVRLILPEHAIDVDDPSRPKIYRTDYGATPRSLADRIARRPPQLTHASPVYPVSEYAGKLASFHRHTGEIGAITIGVGNKEMDRNDRVVTASYVTAFNLLHPITLLEQIQLEIIAPKA